MYVRLARNQAQKNAPDWVKVNSIDERVDANIEISDGQYCEEVILINCGPVSYTHLTLPTIYSV